MAISSRSASRFCATVRIPLASFSTCFDTDHCVDIQIDPHFKDFFEYASANDIPVILVSRYVPMCAYREPCIDVVVRSGMEPIIRSVLGKLLGEHEKSIEIISNDADVNPDGTWSLKYRHPTRSVILTLLYINVTDILIST